MADSDSTGEQWLEAQRRYWDAWMDMTRRGLDGGKAGSAATANPWADAMEQWWKAVAPSTPAPAQDLLGQMVNIGKTYFSMAEGLSRMGRAPDMAEVVENWTRTMTDVFSKAGQGLNPFAAAAGKGGREGLAFWDLPFDNLARTLSAGMPVPGDFLKAVEAGRATDLRAQVDRFLSAPAIGYARESQEQVQKFARLMLEYEKAMANFQAGFGDLGSRSMEAFRKRLEARATDNGPVNSVREIFNLWVDACEEVYADYALSDDHARRYGQMVNALMAVKQQGAQLVDEGLEAMNMPTRGDLGMLQRRLHDTRCDYQRLRAEAEAMRTELEGLSSAAIELETLRAELEQLRKDVKALAAAPAARADAAGDGGEAPAAAAPSKAAPKRTRAPAGNARKPATTRRKTQS
jgi:class III poly(R)-hydroxyalkanoic acid synthase PhaE subunit